MKNIRVGSMILAIVMAVCCFAGCAGNSSEGVNDGYIATYDAQKISTKLYDFFFKYVKDQYLLENNCVEEAVDESEYMTLKHILVKLEKDDGTTLTEEEAEAEALKIKGLITDDNFDELMAEYSEDPGSQTNPNGYTFKHNDGTMVQEFDDGGWALEVGQVSEPVKTTHGFHIIKKVELDKGALPQVVNWGTETTDPESGEKITNIELVKKDAYDMMCYYAVASDISKDNGRTIPEEDYETEKVNMFIGVFGSEEKAAEFFEAINYTEEEIKEVVEIVYLGNSISVEDAREVNCEELFDEFIASDYYAELNSMYGAEFTEYDPENEELINMIKYYYVGKMLETEQAKVVKNEVVYSQYR